MNSYSPCMDDFNYYDTELHTLNVEGASATGVDQMVLDVDFDTKEQKILEKSFSAYVYTNEELGKAVSTQNAVLNMTNLSENTDYAWYAVVTNETTSIKKSSIYEFTTAKKNDSNIADGENQNGADTDKTGSIVTGDVSKAGIFALLGLTVSAAGAVIVIKKKEA